MHCMYCCDYMHNGLNDSFIKLTHYVLVYLALGKSRKLLAVSSSNVQDKVHFT